MDVRRAVTVGVCVGAFVGGLAPAAADAATLTPLDPAVPARVLQLVPLGADGAQIALNAEDPQIGPRVSGGAYLARDDIYLAGADGSGLRAAWIGRWGSVNSALTATGDGTLAAWINATTLADGAPLVISTLTGKTMHVRSTIGHPTYAVTGFLAGTSSLYATTDAGDVWRIAADGRLGPVTSTGQGVTRRVTQTVVASHSGEQLGACGVMIRKGRQDGVRLGVFDPDAGAWRYTVLAPGSSSTAVTRYSRTVTCAVSDRSSTVATVVRRGRRTLLAAVLDGQPRTVGVPSFAQVVGAVSPTGRYVLVGSGGPFPPMSPTGIRPQLALGSRLAVVDLLSGRTALVRGLHPDPGSRKEAADGFFDGTDAVFSPDETHLGLGRPQTAGAFVIDTHTGSAAYVPIPAPPVGFQFAYPAMRPLGFSSDGSRFAFGIYDQSEDITLLHPYSVPLRGGRASYMLSDSDDSFQNVVSSADGARTWIVSSSTCHSTPRYGALSLAAGGLWDTPFTVPSSPLSP